MNAKQALQFIKDTLEGVAKGSVKALQQSVFKVDIGEKNFKVTNLPKVQDISGSVKVVNQDSVERLLKLQLEAQKDVRVWAREALKDLVPPQSIKVSNLNDIPKPPTEISVKNQPTSMRVNNLDELAGFLEEINDTLADLPKKMPKTEIPAFPKFPEIPRTVIPPYPEETRVNNLAELIEGLLKGLQTNDPEKYIPVRLSDGDEFYEALANAVSGGGRYAFMRSDGLKGQARMDRSNRIEVGGIMRFVDNDIIRETDDITYECMETAEGEWMIQKIDTSGGVNSFRYASQRNNTTITTYAAALAAYLDLNYGVVSEAL